MNNIYITSDLHFCHNKDFLYKPRGFKNQYEMNKTIILNWNSLVDDEDDVYVLGDICLSDTESGIKCLRQLRGRIHIITGNHDSKTRIELYKQSYNVVEVIECATILKYNKLHFYLSHYPTLCDNYDYDKSLKARMINLCGHTHTKDKFFDWDKGIIYHCELDAHNNYPVLLDTVIDEIKEKLNKENKV